MSQRNQVLATGLALAAVVAAYWFLAVAPKRAEIATVKDQITQAQARRDTAVAATGSAQRMRADYQRDYATLARLGKAAPPDDDVASLVYQLESVARANKVDFRAVKFAGDAAPAPDASSAGKTAAPADGAAKSSAGKDAASSASATPAPPTVAQAPPGATVGTAGLITLPLTLTLDGGYLPMQRMLGAIDRLADVTGGAISVRGRLVTVDGFALSASRFGFPKVKAIVSATAYIVPPVDGVAADGSQPAAATSTAPAAPGAGAVAPPTATAAIGGVG
jgi:hypothetical protein